MKNVKEVTTSFEAPGHIKYIKEYLIDVPETENKKGRKGILVTLLTMELADNNEVNAQIIAEADWYDISLDEYSNEELGGLMINIPYMDIDVNFYYIVDYGQHKKVSFKEYLGLSAKDRINSVDTGRFTLQQETNILLSELLDKLPEKYLSSTLRPSQVIDRIKSGIYDDAEKGEITYYDAHRIYYSIVVNFDFQGQWTFPLNNLNTTDNIWYVVREMLEKGKFIKSIQLPDKPILVDCGDAKVLLEHRSEPSFRISIFDGDKKHLFNTRFMKERMRVEGKFALTCGDRSLAELEGGYIIYQYENLYAAVKIV